MTLVQDGVVTHLQWKGDSLRFLDQTLLPGEVKFIESSDYRVICDAIKRLAIRGAPAIGIAAGYALALGARKIRNDDPNVFAIKLAKIKEEIASARPTAVNLFWALDQLMSTLFRTDSVRESIERIGQQAVRIHEEDVEMCRALSEFGKDLIPQSGGVMTHCNTGGLATGGYGTALGVIYAAHRDGKDVRVIVNETRPLLQGARLTTWELKEAGIPFVLITDSMAAHVMALGKVDCVIVGADRIALNGDTANKIGTYSLAVVSAHHQIPFYVAAPTSTIDPELKSGDEIPIEWRNGKEVTHPFGDAVVPMGTTAMNPAFDVTPSDLISAIITEKGICKTPYTESFEKVF